MQTVKLNTGDDMPAIGFGTWQIENGPLATESTLEALWVGYRLIDTAKIYGNEESVGRAIANCGIKREEIFVTTKLWNDDQGYDSGLEAFDASLEKLGLEYLDLYLIHWPFAESRHPSWDALEHLYKTAKAKAVGVSNYEISHLEELQKHSQLIPAVNQIKFHPFNYRQQKQLLEYCKDKGIVVEAYSPLARAQDMDNPVLTEIAQANKKSVAQIMIRWCIQKGTVPLPKSKTKERIKENFDVFGFELSSGDMAAIDALSLRGTLTL